MLNRLFNYLFQHRQEDQFQQGCGDRTQGNLPKSQDSAYLRGYLSNRPQGLDDAIQYFSTLEAYLNWKQRSNFLK
jgi:hypothetical protein